MSARLVAIDLDGTLIDESLTIGSADRAAIREAVAAGWIVTLASGRMYAASKPFARELALQTPMIVLQGSAVYDLETDKPLLATTLATATALRAYDDLKARGFLMQLYFDDSLYLDEIDDRARHYIRLSRVEPVLVPDLRALLTGPPPKEPGPMKVLGIDTPEHVQATIPVLAAALGEAANVFRSLPMYLEVTDPDANKGFALQWLARRLGVALHDTAAIGDADNDVPMLRIAGRSFAVANASPAAKVAAQFVVPPQSAGGVAAALHELLKEPAHEHA